MESLQRAEVLRPHSSTWGEGTGGASVLSSGVLSVEGEVC